MFCINDTVFDHLFITRYNKFHQIRDLSFRGWGHMHLRLLGLLGWAVPDPINVEGLFPTVGVLSLSWWVGLLPTPPVTSTFILSIIMSMLALFVAVIAAICLLCCSCSIANKIACDLPSSSAAAVSCGRSAASLKRDCLP